MPIFVRDAGVWKEPEPFVRDAGVWKPLDTGHARDGGAWKEFHSSVFDPSTPPGTLVEQEGGYYLGVLNGFHLFTPPRALGHNDSVQWKTTNTATSGTNSYTDGVSNTNNMLPLASHPAANWAKGLVIYGLNDFYIPAFDELLFMYNTRGVLPGAEAYEDNWYWSSTESNTSSASIKNFSFGNTSGNVKSGYQRVRVLRRRAV